MSNTRRYSTCGSDQQEGKTRKLERRNYDTNVVAMMMNEIVKRFRLI